MTGRRKSASEGTKGRGRRTKAQKELDAELSGGKNGIIKIVLFLIFSILFRKFVLTEMKFDPEEGDLAFKEDSFAEEAVQKDSTCWKKNFLGI